MLETADRRTTAGNSVHTRQSVRAVRQAIKDQNARESMLCLETCVAALPEGLLFHFPFPPEVDLSNQKAKARMVILCLVF